MSLEEGLDLINKVCDNLQNTSKINEKDVAKYLNDNYVILDIEAEIVAHHLTRCMKDLSYLSNVTLKKQ